MSRKRAENHKRQPDETFTTARADKEKRLKKADCTHPANVNNEAPGKIKQDRKEESRPNVPPGGRKKGYRPAATTA